MKGLTNLYNKDKNMARLFIILISVFILFSILRGKMFLNIGNMQSMGKQFPEFGLLSLGMAMALMLGGIDLSVVFIANLSSVVIAILLPKLINEGTTDSGAYMLVLLCFLIAIIVGAICGVLNGLLISVVGIPAILATLGTQSLYWGISVVLTGGSTKSGFTPHMSNIINKKVIGIPMPVIIFVIVAVIIIFLMNNTKLGYKLKMLGTNSRATIFSGMNNVALYTINYMIIGILSALAGIIMIGRFNSAKADYGASYTMQAILIAVLGGVDPSGGKGNIQGVCLAILIIQMVSSWLNMYENISNFYREIIWGGLLIFVLIFNYFIAQRERKIAMKK